MRGSSHQSRRQLYSHLLTLTALILTVTPAAAQDVTAEQLLRAYSPRQRPVQVETPAAADIPKCKRDVVRGERGSSWVVYGPQGQVLRRFTDTDGDNKVDQFRYYNLGIEVYRDIDSNGNEKIDQHRWLNTGGTRWGIDRNEDGRIDSWKRLSAQEACQIAVTAMIARDVATLRTVLIDNEDVRALQLNRTVASRLMASVGDIDKKLAAATRSPLLKSGTQWVRFDAQPPGLVPSDSGAAGKDLLVCENAMAIVQSGGKDGLIHIGELVQVGDVWKLTAMPQPAEGSQLVANGSVLMQPEMMNASADAGTPTTPEMQGLLKELQELDNATPAPAAGRAAVAAYNKRRAEILSELARMAPGDEARDQWTQQLADGLAAAVQTGAWPEGLKLLQNLERDLKRNRARSALYPYVVYRRLLADYATRLQTNDDERRQEAQEWWRERLALFARDYPDAPDAGDALIQLAMNQEFLGKIDEAEGLYRRVVSKHPSTPAGKQARGALYRLGMEGKPLTLAGKDLRGQQLGISNYRGKVTLVAFWTTWCRPCTQELPQLIELYRQYHAQGFEVLGVNLDHDRTPIAGYLSQHRVPWNHLHDSGGMQGPTAQQFGIISLPTMFLVDRTGKVLARSISVEELKTGLPAVLQGRPLSSTASRDQQPLPSRNPGQ